MLAQGAIPESNQTSNIPLNFFIAFLHFSHCTVKSPAACKSFIFLFVKFSNSNLLSTTFLFPHSHSHKGIGMPQYLCLEIFQSSAFSTQFSNLSLANAGIHLTFSFSFNIFFFIFPISKNNCLLNLNINGLLHLQHNG